MCLLDIFYKFFSHIEHQRINQRMRQTESDDPWNQDSFPLICLRKCRELERPVPGTISAILPLYPALLQTCGTADKEVLALRIGDPLKSKFGS